MNRTLTAALCLLAPSLASAQSLTLRSDDGSFESMWSLTSPSAGPDDWIGVAYAPPLDFPFRVVSAQMYFLDNDCCSGTTCSDTLCSGNYVDWDRWLITSANLAIDPAGLTPNVSTPIAQLTSVGVPGAGATRTAPPWTLTPASWNIPAGTIFDAPGRVFFVVRYVPGDQTMNFAVDASSTNQQTSIHTSDGFRTRASIWAFGNVGMLVVVEPVFNLRLQPDAQAPRFELAGTTAVTMASVRVTAGPGANTITRVRVRGSGTGNEATGVARVRLIVDADQDGVADVGELELASGAFTADDGTLDLNFSRTLAASTAERWLVTYDLSATAQGGQTFRVEVAQPSDVTASLGTPYLSGAIRGPLLTIAGRLLVERGPASMAARIVRPGDRDLATLQLRLRADNEAFTISSVTLSASGSLQDATQVASLRLYADLDASGALSAGDALLGTSTFPGDDGQRAFSFAARTIAAGTTLDLIAVYDLAATAPGGATFRTLVALPTDLTVLGVASGAPPATGPRALQGLPVIGQQATVGGSLVVARAAASPPDGTAQPGSSQVPMLALTLSAGAESVDFARLELEGSGTGDESTHVDRVSLVRDTNQNGALDAGDVLVSSPAIFTQNDGRVAFALASEQLAAGASRSYLVTYDFTLVPVGGETFRVRLASASALDASGLASGAAITPSGSFPVDGALRTLLGGLSAQLAPEVTPGPRAQPGATDVPLVGLRVAAQGERFDLSRIVVDASGSLRDDVDVARLELWLDGGTLGVRDAADALLATSPIPADDGRATFTPATAVGVLAGQTVRLLVTADLTTSGTSGATLRLTFPADAITARGAITGPTSARGLPLSSGLASLGGALRVELAPRSPTGGVATAGEARVEILGLRASATLEPITVTGVELSASGTGNDAQHVTRVALHLDADGDGQLDPAVDPRLAEGTFAADDGVLAFSGLSRTIPGGGREDWLVAYDFSPAVPAGASFAVSLAASTAVSATAPSGPLPGAAGLPLSSATFTTLGALTIERAPNSPAPRTVARGAREQALLALRASAQAESFVLDRLRLDARGSLDDANELDALRLYVDQDQNGLLSPGDTLIAGPVRFLGDDGAVELTGLGLAVAPSAPVALLATVDLGALATSGRTLRLELSGAASVGATGLAGRAVTSPRGLPASSSLLTVGGTLRLSRSAAALAGRVVLRGDRPVSALGLTASADLEPATLTELRIHGAGSADEPRDLDRVLLYQDLGRDGHIDASDPLLASGTFSTNDGVVALAAGLSVGAGAETDLIVAFEVSSAALGGGRVVLGVDARVDATVTSASSAVTPTGPAITSAASTIGGGFVVAAAPPATDASIDQSAADLAVLGLDLWADNEVCTVDALTVTAAGSAQDAQAIGQVTLALDADASGTWSPGDAVLSGPTAFAVDDGTVRFSGFARTLARGAHERWIVVYTLSGAARDDETLRARLARAEDLSVRCDVSGVARAAGPPIDGPVFRVQELGALRFVANPSPTAARPGFLPRGRVRAPLLALLAQAEVHTLTLDRLTVTASASAPGLVVRTELFLDTNGDGQLDRGDVALGVGSGPDAAGRSTFQPMQLRARPGTPLALLVTVDLSAQAPRGARLRIGLAGGGDVSASGPRGVVPILGTPLFGAAAQVAGDLVVSAAPVRTATIVPNDATDVGLLGLRIDAVDDDFRISSLSVSAAAAEPERVVEALSLVDDRDDSGTLSPGDLTLVANVSFPASSRRAELALPSPVEIGAGQSRRWLVLARLAGRATSGTRLQLLLASNADLRADGVRRGPTEAIGAPVVGPVLEIGASLRVAVGPRPPPEARVAADARNVPLLQLRFAAQNEDVTLSRLTLRARGTLDDARGARSFRLLLDRNADGVVDASDVEVGTAQRAQSDDGPISFSPLAELLGENTEHTYLVTTDLSGTGRAGQTIAVDLLSDADVSALGTASGRISVRGAPIVGAAQMLAGALNLSRGPASPAGVGVRGGQAFPALQVELEARGTDARLEQLTVTLDGNPEAVKTLALWLDADGDGAAGMGDRPLGTLDAPGPRALLDNLGLDLLSGTPARLLLVLQVAEDAAVGGTLRAQLVDDAAVRARSAAGEVLAATGAPLAGSTFTLIATEPGGGAPIAEKGCGCTTADDAPPSPGLFCGGLLLTWGLRRRKAKALARALTLPGK